MTCCSKSLRILDQLPGYVKLLLLTVVSALRKIKMGKKVEKALKDKGQASASSQEHDDDPNKPPEPYVCTGNFAADFAELCKRGNVPVVIPVIPRPRRPSSPPSAPVEEVKTKPGKGGDKKGKQVVEAPPEVEPEKEVDPNAEPVEPPPKTYVVKDKFEYFKPCIQVEMDHPDKGETVTEVYIRGWRLEEPILSILKECWLKMERLTTISLWNTGLNEQRIEFLAELLPIMPNLKNLILDNNVIPEQNYHILIRDESPLTSLSLRYNEIDDTGATNLSRVLGTLHHQNTRLVSLNLTGNRITDEGATKIAEGLRMNRNLLVLNLGNNQISDAGTRALAEVLSRFALTHEETVERRKMMFERGQADRKSVSQQASKTGKRKHKHKDDARDDDSVGTPPPGSRRAESRDRPGSVRSMEKLATVKGKSAKSKKDDKKGKEKEEEKTPKGGKGAKEAADPKGTKKASIVAEATKTKGGKEKSKGGKGKAGAAQPESEGQPSESPEAVEVTSPLMENTEYLDDGKLYIVGNRALLCLNLAHNKVTEKGLEALHLAMCYQSTMAEFSHGKPGCQGLMRLMFSKNTASADSEVYRKLSTLMVTKDPFYKPPATTPDLDNQSRNSKQP